MLILPQEVEVNISGANLKHFEDLGYEIPRYKNKKGKMVIPKGTKIIVNVLDLQKSSSTLVRLKCDNCGIEYNRKYYQYTVSHENSDSDISYCDNCFHMYKSKYTYENMLKYFNDANLEPLILKEEFKNSNMSIKYKCKICGHESKVSLGNVLLGRGCKVCKRKKLADEQRYDYEYVYNYFKEQGCELLSKEYINCISPTLEYICHCGETNITSFASFFNNNYHCRYCRGKIISEKKTFSYKYVKNIFKENNCELLEDTYTGHSQLLKYKCECGNIDYKDFEHFQRGQRCDECAKKKKIEKLSGENGSNWNPNLTDEERKIKRAYPEYREWVKSIFEKDDYTCQKCGVRGSKLNAHHKDSYHWCKERRLDINNGVTLCEICHKEFHSIYGRHDNTEQQYNDWIYSK